MSGKPPFESGADGIEQGKRLIRLGGDKGMSLAEKLANRFQRLTWRTPLHSLRLRGRHPLKLLAVPDDIIPGDPLRGRTILEGQLSFRGETCVIETLDFAALDVSAPFAEYLHSFAWLRDLATVATRSQGAPIAEGIMRRWLAAHAATVTDPAWRFDLTGWRMLFWTAHAPLILSSTDLIYRSAVLNALARMGRHLDRGAERAVLGTPRVAAWCGVIASGLLVPGGQPQRLFGEAGLARALAATIFDDGGTVARTPVGQLDIIMALAMLNQCYAARRQDPHPAIAATLNRMVPALLGVCHGDGGLSSWQGGAPVHADTVAAIVSATGVRARPLRQARDWGYQRLAAGSAVVILDAAPPPIARLAEGGCASTLAFELSDGDQRVVVNCGAARMAHAQVPKALAEGLRTTAAHSTLVVADTNSTAIHTDGTLGRGVTEVELDRQESEGSSRVEVSHDGYVRRHGLLHRRVLVLAAGGRELRGEDLLLPAAKRRRGEGASFAVRFHLAPGVEASPTADGMGALLRLPDGPLWQFRCRGGALQIDDSLWLDGDGWPYPTQQLVVSGDAPAGGASISWLLKRAG